MKFYMTKGLPGSGKSTWAKKLVQDEPVVRVNRDDIRLMIHGDAKWNEKREKRTVLMRDTMLRAALGAGFDVVSDDTNLVPSVQAELKAIAEEFRAEFIVKDFTDVPLQTCIERDLKRERSVGKDVILGMYEKWLRPPAACQDKNLPPCILVDMDGTLALFGNHRGPYEDNRCDEDDPHEAVCDMVKGYLRGNPEVSLIIMSGRDEGRARVPTEKWLKAHGFDPEGVFMRPAGDMRHDDQVKRELYETYILGQYNVRFVVDDRDSVVNLWRRDLGLKCFQVEFGGF